MNTRIQWYWEQVWSSYWFVPTLMALGAIGLSYLTLSIDERWPAAMEVFDEIAMGDVGGVRSLLATVAGSMITIAGVTFSITIVALTLASQQFGPRIINSFMRDRGNQIVLGTFIATFLYCLLVMRAVGHVGENSVFMPNLSVTIGLLMAIVSIGVLIFFIHHVSRSILADNLIAGIGNDLDRLIDALRPEDGSDTSTGRGDSPGEEHLPDRFEEDATAVAADHWGYIQGIDVESLVELAVEYDLMIRLHQRIGRFVLDGTLLAQVYPAGRCDAAAWKKMRTAFVLGDTRTQAQDLEFGINELVEIAVRALSPGINDPFTATRCVDRLATTLARLQRRELPSRVHRDDRGRPRLITNPLTFEQIVDVAFNQIRQNIAHHIIVRTCMLEAIELLVSLARRNRTREVLRRHMKMIAAGAGRATTEPADRGEVAQRVRRVQAALRGT